MTNLLSGKIELLACGVIFEVKNCTTDPGVYGVEGFTYKEALIILFSPESNIHVIFHTKYGVFFSNFTKYLHNNYSCTSRTMRLKIFALSLIPH